MSDRLTLRPATPADYLHFARLFPELGTGGNTYERARWQADMMSSTFLMERAGEVVGYAYAELMGREGYVRHVVVAPEARAQGIGRALMQGLARRLGERGCTTLRLNVKVDNTPAIRLYQSSGLREVHRSAGVRLDWRVLEHMPHEQPAPEVRVIAPGDVAALEARFDLLPGQLRDLQERGTWLLLVLVSEREGALGLACFDRDFPGSSPFRVLRPSLAAYLLEATRTHARPEHGFTTLFVENAPELERALVAAGADITVRVLHMVGPCA